MSDFKLSGNNFDSVEEDISTLKELFPSIVTGDNEIDFDELRDIFEKNGETVVDDSEEHYKFTWWGKKEAKRVAKESTTKTLRPSKKDSKNWEDTENIYIEGDNLDALKILLGSYRDSIKMIYIDPPYNTGHDFVYKDNRTENIKEHLENTGQLNEDGFLFENAKTDGKFHSNWLNMMYPRLYLARKLLTDDGAIFISIDENEMDNLKKICDEIFGEENYITTFAWLNTVSNELTDDTLFAGANLGKIKKAYEYVLAYGKNNNIELIPEKSDKKFIIKLITNGGNNINKITLPRGIKCIKPINKVIKGRVGGKKDYYDILNEEGMIFEKGILKNDVVIEGPLRNPLTLTRFFNNETVIDRKGQKLIDVFFNENGMLQTKKERAGDTPSNIIIGKGSAKHGTLLLKNLFGFKIFDFSKPPELIKYLIERVSDNNDIILDFFSGSASTSEAIFNLNKETDKNRSFILVQIPESTSEKSEAYTEGYENICEIGKERIRRAGDKILEESDNKELDIGFKVFKVDESNFIPWNPVIENESDANQAILSTGNNIVDGRSELDLIYELLLKLNMELTCSIEEKNINNHKIYVIDDGYALICLDSNIDESITDDLLTLKEDLMTEHCEVILRDDALDDNLAINIYETLKSNDVEFHTI